MNRMNVKRILLYLTAAAFLIFAIGNTGCSHETALKQNPTPGYWRMPLGTVMVTALYDGFIDMNMSILKNASEEDIRNLLERGFVNPDKLRLEVTCFVIDTGNEKILVDMGAGTLFGPTLGKAYEHLSTAGFNTDDITAVLITHMHPDHTGGLIDDKGQMRFNHATVYTDKKESEFWLSQENMDKAPENAKSFFTMARATSDPYRAAGSWKTFEKNDTLVAGIKAIPAPGHTPGHTAFQITSGTESLLIIGDTVHCMAAQLPNPEIRMTFDTTPDQAITTRKALFDQVSTEKIWVGAMHLPFPGLGKLRKEDTGSYTWIPVMISQGI